jgi:hypothetical protein
MVKNTRFWESEKMEEAMEERGKWKSTPPLSFMMIAGITGKEGPGQPSWHRDFPAIDAPPTPDSWGRRM